jgi:hypothetical protein
MAQIPQAPEGAREKPSDWRPLLDGPLGERARRAVGVIAEDLRTRAGRGLGAETDASLASGQAGLAVACSYLDLAWPGSGLDEAAQLLLDSAVELLATTSLRAGLYDGFTGVAWAVAHLEGLAGDGEEAEDPCSEIDAALQQILATAPWKGEYDLVRGLVGFGAYALERRPRGTADPIIARVIQHLDELAQHDADGITWWTPREHPRRTQGAGPGGHYNLGLAHGVPGVIAFLAGAVAQGVDPQRSVRLLEGAVSWLLRRARWDGPGSCFSHSFGPGLEQGDCRSAWCYGDPGIAAALLLAGQRAARPDWEQAALHLARRAAQRPPDETGVVDAGLCHGAAGLGHVFNRLFQATSDPVLADAARFWLERAIDMQQPGQGVGGYRAWGVTADGAEGWIEDASFLPGAAGVALALLASITPLHPAWDRVLLLSLSPNPAAPRPATDRLS